MAEYRPLNRPNLASMPREILSAICEESWLMSMRPSSVDVKTAINEQSIGFTDRSLVPFYKDLMEDKSPKQVAAYNEEFVYETLRVLAHEALRCLCQISKELSHAARPFLYKQIGLYNSVSKGKLLTTILEDQKLCDLIKTYRTCNYHLLDDTFRPLCKYVLAANAHAMAIWWQQRASTRLMLVLEAVMMRMTDLEHTDLTINWTGEDLKFSVLRSTVKGSFLPKLRYLTYRACERPKTDAPLYFTFNVVADTMVSSVRILHYGWEGRALIPLVSQALLSNTPYAFCPKASQTSKTFNYSSEKTGLDDYEPGLSVTCQQLARILQTSFPEPKRLHLSVKYEFPHLDGTYINESQTIPALSDFLNLTHLSIDRSDLTQTLKVTPKNSLVWAIQIKLTMLRDKSVFSINFPTVSGFW